MKRVCVIGVGPAGVIALKLMAEKPEFYKPTAFEKGSGIGGVWLYTEKTGRDNDGEWVASTMYRNLRTNFPKEGMTLADFPFSKELPSFISHRDYLNYLQTLCRHYNLEKFIQFQTTVTSVRSKQTNNGQIWLVSVRTPGNASAENETYEFDAVFDCSGHFTVPKTPEVKGMDLFQGHIVHSRDYRYPEMFQGHRVLILGASFSGLDIAQDLTRLVKKIYLCHDKDVIQIKMQDNIIQKLGIRELNENSAILKNGEEIQVDSVIFCTGYRYVFPFLDSSCGVDVFDGFATPLYKHVLHIDHHTLAFIGLCTAAIRPLVPKVLEYQVRFALASLEGVFRMPSREKMMDEIKEEFKWYRMYKDTKLSLLGCSKHQKEYFEDLCSLGKIKLPPNVFFKMMIKVCHSLDNEIMNFRDATYTILNDEEFSYSTHK